VLLEVAGHAWRAVVGRRRGPAWALTCGGDERSPWEHEVLELEPV
jgi:hypothetical protein